MNEIILIGIFPSAVFLYVIAMLKNKEFKKLYYKQDKDLEEKSILAFAFLSIGGLSLLGAIIIPIAIFILLAEVIIRKTSN